MKSPQLARIRARILSLQAVDWISGVVSGPLSLPCKIAFPHGRGRRWWRLGSNTEKGIVDQHRHGVKLGKIHVARHDLSGGEADAEKARVGLIRQRSDENAAHTEGTFTRRQESAIGCAMPIVVP
jgi:hypothetical protein